MMFAELCRGKIGDLNYFKQGSPMFVSAFAPAHWWMPKGEPEAVFQQAKGFGVESKVFDVRNMVLFYGDRVLPNGSAARLCAVVSRGEVFERGEVFDPTTGRSKISQNVRKDKTASAQAFAIIIAPPKWLAGADRAASAFTTYYSSFKWADLLETVGSREKAREPFPIRNVF